MNCDTNVLYARPFHDGKALRNVCGYSLWTSDIYNKKTPSDRSKWNNLHDLYDRAIERANDERWTSLRAGLERACVRACVRVCMPMDPRTDIPSPSPVFS